MFVEQEWLELDGFQRDIQTGRICRLLRFCWSGLLIHRTKEYIYMKNTLNFQPGQRSNPFPSESQSRLAWYFSLLSYIRNLPFKFILWLHFCVTTQVAATLPSLCNWNRPSNMGNLRSSKFIQPNLNSPEFDKINPAKNTVIYPSSMSYYMKVRHIYVSNLSWIKKSPARAIYTGHI